MWYKLYLQRTKLFALYVICTETDVQIIFAFPKKSIKFLFYHKEQQCLDTTFASKICKKSYNNIKLQKQYLCFTQNYME